MLVSLLGWPAPQCCCPVQVLPQRLRLAPPWGSAATAPCTAAPQTLPPCFAAAAGLHACARSVSPCTHTPTHVHTHTTHCPDCAHTCLSSALLLGLYQEFPIHSDSQHSMEIMVPGIVSRACACKVGREKLTQLCDSPQRRQKDSWRACLSHEGLRIPISVVTTRAP